jgi:hypothetical protein
LFCVLFCLLKKRNISLNNERFYFKREAFKAQKGAKKSTFCGQGTQSIGKSVSKDWGALTGFAYWQDLR